MLSHRRPGRLKMLAAVAALLMVTTACAPAPVPPGMFPSGPASAAPEAPSSAPATQATPAPSASATRTGPPTSHAATGGKTTPISPSSPSTKATPSLSWGPTKAQYDDAATAVAEMSLEQRAGQVLVQFYSGTNPATAVDRIKQLHLAGSIIMGDNVPKTGDGGVDVEAMGEVTGRLSSAAGADGRDWPALISVDQEGGLVARVRSPLTQWPTPMTYGASGDPQMARKAQKSINQELSALGFTVNFAPNADVTIGAADPTIRSRSYGNDPDLVGAMASSAMDGALAGGVLPAVKHFPGHGSVTTDSHLDLPVQDASLKELKKRDWKPFRAAIDQGAPMIMMGHIAVEALEPSVPSSVSAASYKALRELGFEGVVVTDAMNMGAIQEKYAPGEAAAKALTAGADLILMPPDVEAAHAAIVDGVQDGSIPKGRLAEAATRVVALMKYQASIADPAGKDVVGSHADESRAASAAGLTVLEGPCKGGLIGSSVSVSGGTEMDRERFRAAAQRHGISVGSGPEVALLGAGQTGTGDIVVALAGPWALAGMEAATSRIALYGRTPGAFDALLDFLTGEADAPGKLPADVGSLPPGTGCGSAGSDE